MSLVATMVALAVQAAGSVPDGRCTFAATPPVDRVAIVEAMETRRFVGTDLPASQRLFANAMACARQAAWEGDRYAVEGGRALDLIAHSVLFDRLSALQIDVAIIDRWFAALDPDAQVARRMSDADSAYLAGLIVDAGSSRRLVATNCRSIMLYALSLSAIEAVRRESAAAISVEP